MGVLMNQARAEGEDILQQGLQVHRSASASAPQGLATTSVAAAPNSHVKRNLAVLGILVIFLIVFFAAPVVPYTFASYSYGGYSASATGTVSMSYALFHCGEVSSTSAGVTIGGYTYNYGATASGWAC
jgi:hypothetical protein